MTNGDGGRDDVNADGMLKIDVDDLEDDDCERFSTGSLLSSEGDSGGGSDRSRHTVICTKKMTRNDNDNDNDDDDDDDDGDVKNRPAADTTTSPPPDVIMHHNSIKRKGSKRKGCRRRSFAGMPTLEPVPGETVHGNDRDAGNGVRSAVACPARIVADEEQSPESTGIVPPSTCADGHTTADALAITLDTSTSITSKDDGVRSTTTLRSQQVGRSTDYFV